jgi:hypothetical protein
MAVGWTLIGSGHAAQSTAGAAASLTVPAGGVPKSALVVVFAVNVSAVQGAGDGVTDGRGNSYTRKTAGALALYESYNLATALQSGDSITYTPAAANKDASLIAFYRTDAITDSDPFDASAVASATSTSPSSGATGAPAVPNEAAIGCIWALPGSQTTFTAGSGWTALTGLSWNDTANAFWMELFPEYQEPVSAAVTANGTLSGSSFWAATAATFKLAPDPQITSTLGALPTVLRRELRIARFDGPFPLADAITILPPGPPLVLEIVSAEPLGRLSQTHKIRPTPWVRTFPLAPLKPGLTITPPVPPDPSLSMLGGLAAVLRTELRRARFEGPYPLADAITIIPPGAPLPPPALTMLGALPRALPRRGRVLGPHRLDPLNPVFTPPPPPPPTPADRILMRLGALPDALRPRFRFLRPAVLPDVSALLAVAAQPRIPEALLAAQRAATSQPVITAVLKAKRGSAARLDPNTLYTNTLTDVAEAVAAPANGNIVRARLSGGNVQVQSLAASSGSAWTSWTTIAAALAPAAGLGVALTTEGNAVVIAYVKSGANTTIQIQASFDYGASFGAAVSVANTGVITDLALAFNPADGSLVLVAGDSGGTIRAFRSANFGATWGAAVTLVPPGSAIISSIALAYVGADWYALFGWQTGDLALIGSAIFGNGGLQTANTWSAVTDVLGVDPGSGNTPNVTGFAWGADGGHAILVETWAVLGGYNATNAYAMECSSTSAFAGGYWTEPAPFPYRGRGGKSVLPYVRPSTRVSTDCRPWRTDDQRLGAPGRTMRSPEDGGEGIEPSPTARLVRGTFWWSLRLGARSARSKRRLRRRGVGDCCLSAVGRHRPGTLTGLELRSVGVVVATRREDEHLVGAGNGRRGVARIADHDRLACGQCHRGATSGGGAERDLGCERKEGPVADARLERRAGWDGLIGGVACLEGKQAGARQGRPCRPGDEIPAGCERHLEAGCRQC